jgi:WD40 repeat protein
MTLRLSLIFFSLCLVAQQYKLETVVQKGHSAAVKCVAISPDYKYVATGSRDRSVKIWDLESKRELRSLNGADLSLNSLQFSPDGKWLAAGSFDQYARVWEVISGKLIFTSPKHDRYITDVAFTSDGSQLIAAGYSDSLEVYDISSGRVVKKIMVNADQSVGMGTQLEVSPDGKYLAVGEDNKVARIFRIADWSLIHTFKPEKGWCGGCGTQLAFSRDSKLFAKFSHYQFPEVYHIESGALVARFPLTENQIGGIVFSPDASKLYVVADTMLSTLDMTTKTRIDSVRIGKHGLINEVALDKDGKNVFLACDHTTTLIWNLEEKKIAGALEGILQQVDKGGLDYDPDSYWQSHIAQYTRLKNTISLSPDNKHFASGKIGRKAVWWNLDKGNPEKIFDGHSKAVICMEHSLDGKFLATGDASGEAKIWDLNSGTVRRTITGHKHPILCMSVSPNAEYLALGSWDGYLSMWNMSTGAKEAMIDLDNASAYSLSFSPDGLYLAVGRLNKTLELYEPDSKKLVRGFVGHSDIVSCIAFGPEKYKMLSASWDGSARIWDITTGIMLQKFKTNTILHAAIFTPDGKKIITAGDDRVIRIWDVQSGKVSKTLEGHQAQITSLQITTDGKSLLSYSLDGVIKCWNLDKGAEFYEHIHISERDWMAKTKDGYFNATNGARNAIHFVKGMEVFKPEQFFNEFYRPDLLSDVFKTRGANLPSSNMSLENRLQQSPPPIVRVAILPFTNGREAAVHVKMTDMGGGVIGLRLMHNGKNIEVKQNNLVLPQSKNESKIYIDTIELVGGMNTFEAVGINKANIESQFISAQYMAQYAPNASICHVFSIGINKYKNSNMVLSYARNDAESFVKVFKEKGGALYKDIVVHELYDENATKKNILDTLDKLAKKVASHDVFVFYYAGHGSMNDGKFYFIPQECTRLYESGALSSSAIEATEIQLRLQKIKALKQIIIMDACQSGGSVELLAMRGGMEEKAMAQLSRSAGIHVMASAGSEQNAKEIATLKHGLFTYVLLKALEGSADGAPDDGKITLFELKSYLDDQVPELNKEHSQKIQYPYTFSRGHDFPLVLE